MLKDKDRVGHGCEGCHYWRYLYHCYGCHYMLVTGERRGCDSGEACTRRKPLDAELVEAERKEALLQNWRRNERKRLYRSLCAASEV